MKRWGVAALAVLALALAGCTDDHDDSPSPTAQTDRLDTPPEIEAYIEALRAEDIEGVRVHLVAIDGDNHDVVGERITALCAQEEIDRYSSMVQSGDVDIYVKTSPLDGPGGNMLIEFERETGESTGKGVWIVDEEWKVLASGAPECLAP